MPAKPGYIEGQGLSGLLIDYRVWRGRFVHPLPRRVHRSAELEGSSKSEEHAAALAVIEAKVAQGDDLNPHLSSRIVLPVGGKDSDPLPKRSDRDLLLAEWGIHHLHLSTEMGRGEFTRRTGDVLFAVFKDSDAYLLGVFDHPSHTNWAAEEIFAVMVRNWPQAGLVMEAKGIIGLSQKYSDEDRLKLRKSGVMNTLEVDGKVHSPAGVGLTTAGTPMAATREADRLMWELNGWREDPYGRLRDVEGVPRSAYIGSRRCTCQSPASRSTAGLRPGRGSCPWGGCAEGQPDDNNLAPFQRVDVLGHRWQWRVTRIPRIPWVTGIAWVARITRVAAIPLIGAPVETIAREDRAQVITVGIDDIGIAPGKPADPVGIYVVDEPTDPKGDPVAGGVIEVLQTLGHQFQLEGAAWV